jgi:hypothetical protein
VDSAGTLFSRLILDLTRASEAVGQISAAVRESGTHGQEVGHSNV